MIKLGILEQGRRIEQNSLSTVENIVDYAIKADEFGFSRFWMTEHHYQFRDHAYTNPDILIAMIAGMTETINVGAAGVLINMHSPISTVTNYKMMNNIFDNRIDLGLANARTDVEYLNKIMHPDLDRSNCRKYFTENAEKICSLINEEEKNFKDKGVIIPPYKGRKPNLWHLATSYKSADFVIKNKLNLARTILHNYGQDLNNLDYNKEELLDLKERFNKQNGYYPQIALSLAFQMSDSIKTSESKLKKMASEIVQEIDTSYKIIPTTPNHLYDLIHEYKDKFGIDDFVLYDIDTLNENKIENLSIVSEKFNLLSVVA